MRWNTALAVLLLLAAHGPVAAREAMENPDSSASTSPRALLKDAKPLAGAAPSPSAPDATPAPDAAAAPTPAPSASSTPSSDKIGPSPNAASPADSPETGPPPAPGASPAPASSADSQNGLAPDYSPGHSADDVAAASHPAVSALRRLAAASLIAAAVAF